MAGRGAESLGVSVVPLDPKGWDGLGVLYPGFAGTVGVGFGDGSHSCASAQRLPQPLSQPRCCLGFPFLFIFAADHLLDFAFI